MYNPEAPFGLEPLGLELGAERLMAERERQGQLLNCAKKLRKIRCYLERF